MSACYVVRAYLACGSALAQSHFFMPCVPQSILDSDQTFALLGGLVTLLGSEVASSFLRSRKQNRGSRGVV